MTILRNIALALSAALILTACSSNQPSESDAQKAITAKFEGAMGSAVRVQEYRDFALSGCRKPEAADGVVCDVEGAIVLDIAGTPQVRPFTEPVRFSKASGIWTAHRP
jgi:ABC-type enterochelin transport system substrate-binding protein